RLASIPVVSSRSSSRHGPPTGALSRREFLERGASLAGGALAGVALGAHALAAASPKASDEVRYRRDGDEFTLSNDAIGGTWTIANGDLHCVRIADRVNGKALERLGPVFVLTLADGRTVVPDQMRIVSGPASEAIGGRRDASRL